MDGWIKLHRKTLDNPVVCKDADHLAVWMYLLMNATHKEYPAMFAGQKIMLQPGQLITGRQSIAAKFNISESKVQRIMKSFEIEQQIEQQTSNKNRLISILSWHDYQSVEQQDEQQVNNKRTTTEQQLNTNKNVKNIENVKNDKESISTWLKKYKIQCKGIFELDRLESYIGILDMELIELIMKKSENKSVPYFETIANKTLLQNIKTIEEWNAKNKPKEESNDRLAFLNEM